MISVNDLKTGLTLELDNGLWSVVEFLHVKPGKGSPFVRTKLKNVVTGQVLERTFNPTDKFQVAVIERKEMQYLYNEGDLYYFMDMESYDQIPLNKSQVEDAMCFMKENMNAQIQFYKGAAFSVLPPTFVELVVAETEPGIQGDTSKAGYKPAKLETGYEIQIPLFVNQGETIRVDTRDGSYMERIK